MSFENYNSVQSTESVLEKQRETFCTLLRKRFVAMSAYIWSVVMMKGLSKLSEEACMFAEL